jgi:FkbM family methyltransferase
MKSTFKKIKKRLKQILIKLHLWKITQKILNKDIGKPLNENLLSEGVSFYKNFINSNDLVFDVGANYGNRVELFLKLNAKVVAIEPQKKCVAYLSKKFKTIAIENVGLGSKNELKTFYEADNSVLSTFSDDYINKVKDTRHTTSIWNEAEKIQITTLDELIKKYGSPKFIKIDVEGFEYEVLKGLTQKCGVVSLEYNVPELKAEALACIKRLYEIGYSEFNFSINESMLINQNWMNFNEFYHSVENNSLKMSNFGDIYAK